jgi:hypothetical protein
MKKFSWGKVLHKFEYDFDGQILEIIKYSPNYDTPHTVLYYCEELSESETSIQQLLLSWMIYKNLGPNNQSLISGISRAIGLEKNNPKETEEIIKKERERCARICNRIADACAESSIGRIKTAAMNVAKNCARLIQDGSI